MIGITELPSRVRGIDVATVEVWVAHGWVRPMSRQGGLVFEEIDVARIRLILELRDEMEVGEAAMPVVLSLLDQLHATRAELRRVYGALEAGGDRAASEVVQGLVG